MARPAPAADRATQILDLLTDHPGERFTLSELARRLEINKASLHAITAALVERGYLLRHPVDKGFALGPRLIAVGEAARDQFPVTEFARDELQRLSADLAMECVASAAVGDEMVIVDRAGPVRPIGVTVAVGYRFALVPPMGTVFIAWSPPDEIDTWLRRLGSDVTDAELDQYRVALAAVRERGFSAGLDADGSRSLAEALADRDSSGRRSVGESLPDEYSLVALEGAAEHRVSTVGAPVFDVQGAVPLAIYVLGFRDALTARQVPEIAERLLKATDAITESIHGRRPDG